MSICLFCFSIDDEEGFQMFCLTVDVDEEIERGLDVFGFTSFKSGQLETIKRILNGNSFQHSSLSLVCCWSVCCWSVCCLCYMLHIL